MKSAMRVAFLLLLVTGTVTSRDVHEAAAQRQKRGLLDRFYSRRASPRPTDATPVPGKDSGFDQFDAVDQGTDGFNLEDALSPAQKPTADPRGGSCQRNLVEKLNTMIENQNQQLRLLRQMIPTSRLYVPRTR